MKKNTRKAANDLIASGVERFECGGSEASHTGMYEEREGLWVRYSDYELLMSLYREVKEDAIDLAREALDLEREVKRLKEKLLLAPLSGGDAL